ncbi:TPA: DUF2798 domain-containing protein [Providencia rettgeri]|uniref:DUF2798 domain-containing protein n=1 Tax=Providencia TaxID=586 RepID=UPI001BA43128|nr:MULTISPECIES: DUF2798 domain-containing protein [Providencia]EMB5784968.1 DUF2798 domain-containing protein [Providencia rettgeri]MDK7743713.1 DUF2798 domain-containing protein [Providencia rettgeri]MDK7756555.1 DUF2798 domain-containing protein [Providencia rettgeri]HBC7429628.1 DUF2798 domain-containing protein [Providencia rettgeri]
MLNSSFFTRFRKLPNRALHILVPFFLSLIMSGLVSFISTLKSIGFENHLVLTWLTAWMISWAVAFPAVLVTLPLARKFSLLFVRLD